MPKTYINHAGGPLKVSDEDRKRLESWLFINLEDAMSSRNAVEADWREDLARYEGIPKIEMRNVPIENAPNLEITLGAISCDSIYAQSVDLIFGTTPLITCRSMPKFKNDEAAVARSKAMQRFVNWLAANESGIRTAADNTLLDDVQLGTGIYYIPWTETRKKTKTSTITKACPKVYSIPPEDYIVPSGSTKNDQETQFLGIRFYKYIEDLIEGQKYYGWDISMAQPIGAKDWMRTRREMLAKHLEGVEPKGYIYDTYDVYCYFDIDGDGIDEDLLVIYNHTGRTAMKIMYNPQDCRPVEKMLYQIRAHMAYGLGVMKMLRPYQEELTEVHNHQVLNSMLANSRIWKGKTGAISDSMKIWPGKVIELDDPDNDLKSEVMADTYPSLGQIQALILQLADNRVGTNAMSQPRPSQIMGSRTPGTTALAMLQQVNRRFTPAFDSMRMATANALRQCLYRYQEQVKKGNDRVVQHIMEVLGTDDGVIVVASFMQDGFDENYEIELTTSSASVNREADRQNAIVLTNILATYYQRALELTMIASNPETPEPVRKVAIQIAEKAGEVIDRTMRTFDQVRDPTTFIIDINQELDSIEAAPGPMDQLAGMFGGGGGQQEPLALPFGGQERSMA